MKTALVTGSAGFVGRHMVKALEIREFKVYTLDITEGSSEDVTMVLRSDGWPKVDLVVHCAYVVGGRASIDGSPMNLAKNLVLDATLFDWAVRNRQPRVLYFSSSAVYPVQFQTERDVNSVLHLDGDPRLREEDCQPGSSVPIGQPDANYGWAKLTGERLALSAQESGDTRVHIVRPFSGYGTDQSLAYPFPAFIARAKDREDPFTIWGNSRQVRDWIHIDDVVAGALAVVDADVQYPVNLCTGQATAMGDLAMMICEQSGYAPQYAVNPDMPLGVFYRVGQPDVMRQIYTPKITIEEGIQRAFHGWSPA